MFKRYLILLGARTTAGGTVKTASSRMLYALEGDLLDCPGCGSVDDCDDEDDARFLIDVGLGRQGGD